MFDQVEKLSIIVSEKENWLIKTGRNYTTAEIDYVKRDVSRIMESAQKRFIGDFKKGLITREQYLEQVKEVSGDNLLEAVIEWEAKGIQIKVIRF